MVKKVTKNKIIGLFLNNYDKRFYLRELASELKKPHQTIKPYVEELVKEKLLIKTKRKNIVDYYLNFKDKRIYDYLTIAEKEILAEKLTQYTLLRILYDKLSKFFNKNTFVIFGSAVNNTQKASDIDLLVIGKQDISREIENFERIYNKKIHNIQIMNVEKLTPSLIKEIYKKHLILNNTEQIIRFFGRLYETNKLV